MFINDAFVVKMSTIAEDSLVHKINIHLLFNDPITVFPVSSLGKS